MNVLGGMDHGSTDILGEGSLVQMVNGFVLSPLFCIVMFFICMLLLYLKTILLYEYF